MIDKQKLMSGKWVVKCPTLYIFKEIIGIYNPEFMNNIQWNVYKENTVFYINGPMFGCYGHSSLITQSERQGYIMVDYDSFMKEIEVVADFDVTF